MSATNNLILDGVAFNPTGGAVGQVLGYALNSTRLQPMTVPVFDGDSTELQRRITGFFNVVDYGADSTGVTVDTIPFNTAVAAAKAAGGGVIYVPPGTYKRDAEITIDGDNIVVWHAEGATINCAALDYDPAVTGSNGGYAFRGSQTATTTLSAATSIGDATVQVANASGIAVGNFVFLINTAQTLDANSGSSYYVHMSRVTAINGTTLTLETPVKLAFSITTGTTNVTTFDLLENCGVIGGKFVGGGENPLGYEPSGTTNGRGQIGILANAVSRFVCDGVRTERFIGNGVRIDRFHDVLVRRCDFEGWAQGTTIVEGTNSGWTGAIFSTGVNAIFAENTGRRCRHLIDGGSTFNFVQRDCHGIDTFRAAFGTHEMVWDLTVERCEGSRGVIRAITSRWIDNKLTSLGGLPGGDASFPKRVEIIRGQYVTDSGTAIAFADNYEYLLLQDVEAVGPTAGLDMAPYELQRLEIRGGRYATTSTGRGILSGTAFGKASGNILIDGSFIEYDSIGLALSGGPIDQPLENVTIKNVRFRPVDGVGGTPVYFEPNRGYFGDDIKVHDCRLYGTTTSTGNFCNTAYANGRFRSAIIQYSNLEGVGSSDGADTLERGDHIVAQANNTSAFDSNATVLKGAVVENEAPSAAEPIQYVCTTAGTFGSIASVTGDITTGTATLTLTGNDGAKVYVGAIITVAGAGPASADLTTRVIALDADFDTATLADNAGTTVSGAAVSRSNPVFAPFGANAAQAVGVGDAPTFADLKLQGSTPTLSMQPAADTQIAVITVLNTAGGFRGNYRYDLPTNEWRWTSAGSGASFKMTLSSGGLLNTLLGYSTAGTQVVGTRVVDADLAAAAVMTAQTLTDNSGGTASDTIAAIGMTYSQSEVSNAIASLADEINKLRADLAARDTLLEAVRGVIDSHGLGKTS